MQVALLWLLIVFDLGLGHRPCCPPGFLLDPLFTCSGKTNGSIYEYPTFLLQQAQRETVCVPKNDSTDENPKDFGLPDCSTHSMVVTCEKPENSTPFDGCIQEINNTFTGIQCPCLNKTCIRKCCGPGELFDDSIGICFQNGSVPDWRPIHMNREDYVMLTNSFPPNCELPDLLKITHNFSFSNCFSEATLQNRNLFQFNADGSVQVNKYSFPLSQESYCGEHTIHENGELILNNLLVCLPADAHARPAKFYVYGVLLILGGCFLLLTVAVSCYLPELLGTLYHKVTICHNSALMVASFTWGVANLLPEISYANCVALSLIIQLTFLSSFFWMNVMCIDIMLAFRNLRSVYGPAVDKGWASLLWYSLYACGCPFVLMAITAAMELLPNVPQFIPRPGFGCRNCGFNADTYAILIYFYGPMIFILVFNSALFIVTLLKIRAVERQTAILKRKNKLRNHPETQKILLFGKMFILMGLTWGTEVIGWLVGGPAVVWYLPDLINFLRALFLFFIFVGKKSVLSALVNKFNNTSDDAMESRRRSKSSSMERREQVEVERRGRILARQITQTFRISRQSADSQV